MTDLVVISTDELRALVREAVAEALGATPTPVEPEALLDQAHIAERLGVSTRQVRRMVGEGMPEVRVGDAPRYEVGPCLDWLRARRAGGGR